MGVELRRAIPWTSHGVSPARYVAEQGGFDAPTVAVHCVHLDPEDVTLLKEKGVAVAHCPKSNGKLGAGTQIGSGFTAMRDLLGAGDFNRDGYPDLIAIDATGAIVRFEGNGKNLPRKIQMGTGFESRTPTF